MTLEARRSAEVGLGGAIKQERKETIENNAFAVIWGLQSNKEMDGRQKPNERKKTNKTKWQNFKRPQTLFLKDLRATR